MVLVEGVQAGLLGEEDERDEDPPARGLRRADDLADGVDERAPASPLQPSRQHPSIDNGC